jgi:carbon monoxide dehydrogenase subunit G
MIEQEPDDMPSDVPGSSVRVGGEYLVRAPRDTVWEKLQDPVVLQHCIRSCESVVRESDGEYRAVFRFGVGPINKRLEAWLNVEETDPPAEYRLHSSVSLRALGGASGSARVNLACVEADTLLLYTADITVDGWFAGLGDSMLAAAADRYMARFFQRFAEFVV